MKLGMGSALETLCGQAFGAKQLNMLGVYLQRSWVILFTTALTLSPLYIFATPLWLLIGETPAISKAAGLIIFRKEYPAVFSSSNEVQELVAELTPILAISIIINNFQPVLSGVAIGAGWQALVAYINIACYYILGIPLDLILGYVVGLGVKGIWLGMLAGFHCWRENKEKRKMLRDDNSRLEETVA
uniref:Uncharacterized protein n=1 Tax=Chenopodium quinoa TaxID=63459 RepID=A0A803L0R9_CHEQI